MGEFSNIFRALRKANGLTQEELAKRLHITRSRLAMYETGSREPDFETLEMIADFFNVDIDYLMGRSSKTTILPQNVHSVSGESPAGGYYTNPEAAQVAQQLLDDSNLRMLFDAARDVDPEDLRKAAQMLRAWKGEYED